jgi:transposase
LKAKIATRRRCFHPERLDDYVGEDHAVRVIDVFIDDLDISGLGFKAEAAATGRPGYHPKMMLKLYVYGYLNRVQSSRRLEVEAQRNIELMWLTGRLAPDFKTIADFRKDNGEAIRLVCREFVMLCKKLDLLSDKLVAIDGSKFKGVNSRDRNFTRAKMKRRLRDVESAIERYLARLDQADRTEPAADDAKTLQDKVSKLREEMARLKKLEVRMLEAPDKQLSLTDPDARSMKSRGTGVVGYNVQSAVDAKHHLIIAHEVVNAGTDRQQLSPMAKEAKAVLGTKKLKVVADKGYYNGEEIRECEQAGVIAYVAKPKTSPNKAKGQFDRSAFRYIKDNDEYECPAGERLTFRTERKESGKQIRRYWSSACSSCAIKAQCTTGTERRVSRWEHEAVLERAEKRLRRKPEVMLARRSLVEHPFGTLKSWTSSTHLLTKTLPRVSTEMSLQVLAYNMKRAISLLGTQKIVATIRG